ncbi:MAG: GNAT family N-acetyltransferase [Gaiellaceae bacterium]
MIRRLDSDDWETLRELRLRALADAPNAFLQTLAEARNFPEERWRERADASDGQATFVFDDGGMVACFVSDDPDTVFLVAMWVAPEQRGSGAARELVDAVVSWAREGRAARVLLSVERDNARAARFYEKCGFVELDEMPVFPYEPNPGNRFYAFEL